MESLARHLKLTHSLVDQLQFKTNHKSMARCQVITSEYVGKLFTVKPSLLFWLGTKRLGACHGLSLTLPSTPPLWMLAFSVGERWVKSDYRTEKSFIWLVTTWYWFPSGLKMWYRDPFKFKHFWPLPLTILGYSVLYPDWKFSKLSWSVDPITFSYITSLSPAFLPCCNVQA